MYLNRKKPLAELTKKSGKTHADLITIGAKMV